MKNLYKDYFEVSKDKKLTEKVLYTRIAVSVGLILLYMLAMSFAAYAYFMASVSSDFNYIQSANFDMNITVIHEEIKTVTLSIEADESAENTDASEQPAATDDTEGSASEENAEAAIAVASEENIETADEITEVKETKTVTEYNTLTVNRIDKHNYWVNLEPGANIITLSHSGTAETGFCILEIDGIKLITQQVGIDRIAYGQSTSEITFTVNVSEDKVVYLTTHWGTSSKYTNLTDVSFYENADSENVYESANYILDGAELDFAEEVEEEEKEEESSTDTDTDTDDTDTEADDTPEKEVEEDEETPVAEVLADGRIKVTLEESDSIKFIANYYNTTVERIAAYNDIDDPNVVYVGQVIIIPPEDWELPEDDTTEEPTTEEPTTEEPTTEEPTTEEPTTEEPTTEEPTTEEPTTEEPTTEESSTEESTTDESSTEETV